VDQYDEYFNTVSLSTGSRSEYRQERTNLLYCRIWQWN
jgi:hypothetical protein